MRLRVSEHQILEVILHIRFKRVLGYFSCGFLFVSSCESVFVFLFATIFNRALAAFYYLLLCLLLSLDR